MKPLSFLGDSLKAIREFPSAARNAAGRELERVQRGGSPRDAKALPVVAMGVQELRVWAAPGTYRVIYYARFEEMIYVLHAFQKKTQSTSRRDLDLARERFHAIQRSKI